MPPRPPWPPSFERVPDEDWTRQPLGDLALKYDNVEHHGWYANLEPTVDELVTTLGEGDVMVDYSGGTGILATRLLRRLGPRRVGVVIVDASPKFLRLALEKLGKDERVAFRLMRFLKDEKRLQLLDEVLPAGALGRPVDVLASTNAIHLYYDLPQTLESWRRALKDGGRALVQSGNIGQASPRQGEWIIDETVEAIHLAAVKLVREDASLAALRPKVDDPTAMAAHAALRQKFFLPVRPLEHYLDALRAARFTIEDVRTRTIRARVADWYDFLAVYHEGVLGWVGGSERVEGHAPSDEDVRLRLDLMRRAMHAVFEGRDDFPCCWTYITAVAG